MLYGKKLTRAKRKMGHVTVCEANPEHALEVALGKAAPRQDRGEKRAAAHDGIGQCANPVTERAVLPSPAQVGHGELKPRRLSVIPCVFARGVYSPLGSRMVIAGFWLLVGTLQPPPTAMQALTRPCVQYVPVPVTGSAVDSMRERTFVPAVHGFLDMIREGHPDTPLLLVGPLFCGIHESTPGPAAFDPEAMARGQVAMIATGDPAEVPAGRLTLQVIRDELAKVAAQRNDPHLRLIDGLDLFGAADAERHPLPDNLHLGEDAHAVVGSRFAEILTGLR